MSFICVLTFLLGCPLPPEENATTPSNPPLNQAGGGTNAPGAQSGKPPGGGAPAASGGGGSTAPQTGGAPNAGGSPPTPSGGAPVQGQPAGGVLLDMEQMNAQQTQSAIREADFVTISGRVDGECSGNVRVDVIDTSNLGGPTEGGELGGPITTLDLDAPGDFQVAIPKGRSVNLTALCDGDKDGKITAESDKLSLGARLGVIDTDTDGVELVLESIQPPKGCPPSNPPE